MVLEGRSDGAGGSAPGAEAPVGGPAIIIIMVIIIVIILVIVIVIIIVIVHPAPALAPAPCGRQYNYSGIYTTPRPSYPANGCHMWQNRLLLPVIRQNCGR